MNENCMKKLIKMKVLNETRFQEATVSQQTL